MGLLDHLKGAAGKAGGAFMDTPGAVGSALGQAKDSGYVRTAARPFDWAWDNTVGEMGDRDYTDHTGDLDEAASQRDAFLASLQTKDSYRNSAASQQMIAQAAAAGLQPNTLPLQDLFQTARERGFSGTATADFADTRGFDFADKLVVDYWRIQEGINLAKQDSNDVEKEWLSTLDRSIYDKRKTNR